MIEIPFGAEKETAEPEAPPPDTIKIASFNIQVFGKTKAGKDEVMQILAAIISEFDIVAIQEIRDKSGTAIEKLEQVVDTLGSDYEYIIGPRLDRTRSKEQYAFIYRTGTVEQIGSYTFDDSANDVFHREPFAAHFKSKNGAFDFVMVNIHTDPDEATAEIQALPQAITDAIQHFQEPDIIALGDFNADCTYYNEAVYNSVFPADQYAWLIDNSRDTTVKGTVCTYDRIVTTAATVEDYARIADVYRFDIIHSLTQEMAEDVSDHYPVWAEFYVGRDSE